jgi:hypothetical protein
MRRVDPAGQAATTPEGAVADGAGRRFRPASPATALVLGAFVLVLTVAGLPLGAMAHQLKSDGVSQFVLILLFLAVGVVVAWHQPRNPIGWILLVAAGFYVVNDDASYYLVADYLFHRGTLPFGPVAVLLQPSWAPAIICMGLAILLFPDGRLLSPWWRWLLAAYLAVGGVWMAGAFAISAGAIIGHNIHVDATGNLLVIDHPAGATAWWGAVQDLFFPVLLVTWLVSLAGQLASYRRSGTERRQQLKWLMAGAAVCVIGGGFTLWLSNSHGVLQVANQVATIAIGALPAGIGVAVLKYRLLDIDRIISRTLAYAIVTGLLIGVYAGLVLLATEVLGFHDSVAVAASTLVAAALFSSLRRRVQRVVDLRFNRARYDAELTAAAFAARLMDSVDPDAVRADLTSVVQNALEPAHVSVWLNVLR